MARLIKIETKLSFWAYVYPWTRLYYYSAMASYLFTTISTLAKPRRTITAVAFSSGQWELLPGNTVTGWWQNTITIILLYAIITTIVVGKFSVWLMRRNNDRARSVHTTPGRLPTHIRTICVSLYLIAYLLPYQLPFIRADTHARAKRDVRKRTRTWVFFAFLFVSQGFFHLQLLWTSLRLL